jgi:hypothetical protein
MVVMKGVSMARGIKVLIDVSSTQYREARRAVYFCLGLWKEEEEEAGKGPDAAPRTLMRALGRYHGEANLLGAPLTT